MNRTIYSVILFSILGGALVLSIWGANFGLNERMALHSDENLVFSIIKKMLADKDFNPHFFRYGSPFFYLYAFIYICTLPFHKGHQFSFYIIGRSFTGILGAVAVLFTYLIGAKIVNRKVGLLGAMFHATALVHVQSSHYIKADVASELFILISFYFAYKIFEEGKLKDYILCGIFTGIAVGMKYVFWSVLPLIIGAIFSPEKTIFTKCKKAVTALIVTGISFIVSSPFVFLDFCKFREDIFRVFRQVRYGIDMWGASDINGISTWRWEVGYLFHVGLLYPFIVALIGGLIIFLCRVSIKKKVLFLSFPIAYLIQIMFLNKIRFDRYVLPVVPFFAILSGIFIYYNAKYVIRIFKGKYKIAKYLVFSLGGAIFFIFPMVKCGVMDYYISRKDTRSITADWIGKNIFSNYRTIMFGDYYLYKACRQRECKSVVLQNTMNFGPEYYMSRGFRYAVINSAFYREAKNYSKLAIYKRYYINYLDFLKTGKIIKEVCYPGFNKWFSASFALEHPSTLTFYHNPTIKILELPLSDIHDKSFKIRYGVDDMILWNSGRVVNDMDAGGCKAIYNGGITGPYDDFLKGKYLVKYKLKISDNKIKKPVIAIDITNGGASKVFVQKDIRGIDFIKAGEYQAFSLSLNLKWNSSLEFRVHYLGKCDIWVESIEVVAL